ncbi:MAG: 3-phosphoshikimate 1-carboxyvinyltransferase [Leptonema sp. (in: bacteria)]
MSIFKRYFSESHEILYIPKIQSFVGKVDLIGSKSIANRALLVSSMSEGITNLHNVPNSEDVEILKNTLPLFSVDIQKLDSSSYRIQGREGFDFKKNYFNLNNAGTALRPLVAIISTQDLKKEIIIDGNQQMRKRPIQDLVISLQNIGVDLECSPEGTPPIKIKRGKWKKNQIFISGKTSSQFVSALLMAAPLTNKEIEIFVTNELVSKPYIDLTLKIMEMFSVKVVNENYKYFKIPAQKYKSVKDYYIEGDATAATYFFTAGMLSGPVSVFGISKNSIQGDIQYLDIIQKIGGKVSSDKDSITVENSGTLRGISIDMNQMPDAAMTLAVTGLFTNTPIEIYNVENLRFKESERIAGLSTELKKFGAKVEEKKDGLIVYPIENIRKPKIETYQDHRMAMAFSLGSFLTEIEIIDPDCVKKTYPDYFLHFEKICRL